jgi:hypothetical protein
MKIRNDGILEQREMNNVDEKWLRIQLAKLTKYF